MNLILIGGGSHSNACIDVIETSNKFKIEYIVEKRITFNKKYKIIGEKEFLKKKYKNKNLHISVGQMKTGSLREKLFKFYKLKSFKFPKIISKYSYISKNCFIDNGTIVLHKSVVNRNSFIGKNCIINTGSIIEHDCIIEDNVHIAPGAIILGNVKIKKNSFIGSGSIIKQGKTINSNSIVPAGTYIK